MTDGWGKSHKLVLMTGDKGFRPITNVLRENKMEVIFILPREAQTSDQLVSGVYRANLWKVFRGDTNWDVGQKTELDKKNLHHISTE